MDQIKENKTQKANQEKNKQPKYNMYLHGCGNKNMRCSEVQNLAGLKMSIISEEENMTMMREAKREFTTKKKRNLT